MENYNTSFKDRYKKFLYAQEKYPNVMKNEYLTALKMCNIKSKDVFLNIPADYKCFESILPSGIKYIPVEINENFASLTNYKLCKELDKLPFENQSIDVILSLASLHHSSNTERIQFYKECLRLTKQLVIGDVIKGSKQDYWLNEFVNKNNSAGHKGMFFSEDDAKLIKNVGFNVSTKRISYTWNFKNKDEMIDFCKNLFNLDLIDNNSIYDGIKKYLNLNGNSFCWELLYFICENPYRNIKKSEKWSIMPMYRKILHYKHFIGKEYMPYVDKLLAKDKVKEILGDDIEVAKVVKVLKNTNDISSLDMHDNYLLKSSHGSGWNLDLKYNKDLNFIKSKLKEWNKSYFGVDEPHYKYLKPMFFIEEKIKDKVLGITGNAIVYMFRCIHGKPEIISIKYNNKQNFYDKDWNIFEKHVENIEKPPNFSKMIYICEELSKIFEFVRIDLYLSKDKIYFSEFTFTPCGGCKFYNDKIENDLGKLWK